MNVGDELNGYRIVTSPTNAGGGMSRWSFAEKEGAEYFVKMFLAPRYPLATSPGTEAAKERKRAVCLAFEQRHLEIARRLQDADGTTNLVIPHDFFRVGTTYVKVMERVRPSPLPPIGSLTPEQVLVLVRSLALSLRVLHRRSIVHGDLKPDNVMIQQRGEIYVSKLIDFDEAYVVGEPPTSDLIVGDPAFYSPELLLYVKAVPGAEATLGLASDMFSFGLLLHLLLTGTPVSFDPSAANYPSEVVLNGHQLRLAPLPGAVAAIVAALLGAVASGRPTIEDVTDALLGLEAADLHPSRRVAPPPVVTISIPPAAAPPARAEPARRDLIPPAPPAPPGGGGLRSTMGRRPAPDTEER